MNVKMIISIAVAIVLCFAFTTPALADDPTDYVGTAIPNALNKGTPGNLWDDNGGAFVHPIQRSVPNFLTVESAASWVYTTYPYVDDVVETWYNPEEFMRIGSGDCEDHAFMTASLLINNCTEVDIPGGDEVWAVGSDTMGHCFVVWHDASVGEYYVVESTWPTTDPGLQGFHTSTLDLYPAATYDLWFNSWEVFGASHGYQGSDRLLVRGLNGGFYLQNGQLKNLTRGLNSGGQGIRMGLNGGNGITTGLSGGGGGLNGGHGSTGGLNGR